jgi:ComF family protein
MDPRLVEPIAAHRMPGAASRRASPWLALASRLADAWLPRSCALCDQRLRGDEPGLCRHCAGELPGLRAARCVVCAVPVDADSDPRLCAACRRSRPAFDQTIVLADYAPPLDRLILALKFRGELALARALGPPLAERLGTQALQQPALLVPVPLATRRLAQRGFNQSLAIAAAVARPLGLPLASRLLRRERETRAQSTLALDARQANLSGAFACTPLRGSGRVPSPRRAGCVALVDDVMTSGATLHAAAEALKAAGARFVVNLVAARTP